MAVYIPAFIGAIIGLVTVTKAVSFLFRNFYTATLAAMFAFYLAVIPSIVMDSSETFLDFTAGVPYYIGLVLFVVGFFAAFWFGKISKGKSAEN